MKSESSTAQVKCTSHSSMHFDQIQNIHISNLQFIGCGSNQVTHVEKFVVQDTTFKGQDNSRTALELIGTNAQIVNCIFEFNRGLYRNRFINDLVSFGGYIGGFLGGAIVATNSSADISQCKFERNTAHVGGAIYAEQNSNITISGTLFVNHHAFWIGGVLLSHNSTIAIKAFSEFRQADAYFGGVLFSYNSIITIESSGFSDSHAENRGRVMYSYSSSITIGTCNFTRNVSPIRAVIYAVDGSKIQHDHKHLLIDSNLANRYAVIYLSDSEFIGHDLESVITFSNNVGTLVAFNSNITFIGNAKFLNNQPRQANSDDFHEGSAITLILNNVYFVGVCNLEHNHAENGGAIHSTECKLYVNGNVAIKHNTATGNGGGVYLSTSEINCQQKSTFELLNNIAVHKGGGLHAMSSSIKATYIFKVNLNSRPRVHIDTARISFTQNRAELGGGLSLEANAKLYILKYSTERVFVTSGYDVYNTTIFMANGANYGGAIYVDDDTYSGTCASDTKTECFIQVLATHQIDDDRRNVQSMYFSHNYANTSGSTLYGGLLDRCTVSQLSEFYQKYPPDIKDRGDGIAFIRNVSTPLYYYSIRNNITGSYSYEEVFIDTNLSVSSAPVRVCLCNSEQYDGCTLQSKVLEVKKGGKFTLPVVAVDQIGQPVEATIQTSLSLSNGLSGIGEGQQVRKIRAKCTNLTFSVISLHFSENLTIYASDGPCRDADLSSTRIEIKFLQCSCPIGFQDSGMNNTNCTCECHSDIRRYVQCNSHTELLVKQPAQSRAWISYVNDTGYLVYPNCPFDYCLSTSPPFNLNQPDGADAQCAFNRSSLLCGSCNHGLGLSLGSSHCLPCPSYWPAPFVAITIAAILAGIALVTLLLVLNMTVAVGTLNGVIFYVNVVYANRSILLPFHDTNFVTVFISWLNLELGIDACYFPEMDTYIKTWLQLVFPAYSILLVASVIIISSYSTRFSNLIGKKNPVATLATLSLLSYAKLLEICFMSLSVGILEYPDGSSEMLWLPDATVKYLSGKHIPLFIAAVFILLAGLVYTALLFSWQWLLHLPRWRIFKWSRNPKIQTFIETYHKPYTPKHRYWTGLLLIFRIVLYLVPAVNVSNNPTIALTAISFAVCCFFTLKQFSGSRLYRKWPIDVLETFLYLNILSFATFTWYSLDNPGSNKEAAAYTSVILTFIILLLIIIYHVYTYTTLFSKVKMTKLGRMIDRQFTDADPKPKPKSSPPPDDDIHRFNELLDMIDRPVNTHDYSVSLEQPLLVKPTQSVVEVHHSCDLAAPGDSEAADKRRTPEIAQVEVKESERQKLI